MRVDLPLPVDAAEPADAAAGDDAPAARRPLPSRDAAEREGSLLLVEDHPVSREILALQLATIGFVTDVASDAQAALERFARCRHGLVVTDIGLPGADGYELARGLRAAEARAGRARVPVVALTASALRGERERCVDAGMDDLVVKPATLAMLSRTLRRWLPHVLWPAPASASAQSPPPAAEPVIDQAALDELTGGDEQLNRDVVTRYLAALGTDLDALGRALHEGDVGELRRHAHRIVGASRTVGAHAVAAQASRLEHAAQSAHDGAELELLARELRATAALS
ncbi:MAG TPA: response regulator [Solirubrobacteraceae bacterium]|nr:response regulator [Solirubrobacteraceae bacterium]